MERLTEPYTALATYVEPYVVALPRGGKDEEVEEEEEVPRPEEWTDLTSQPRRRTAEILVQRQS